MARKQTSARPFFPAKHEYEESLKAYINAATMLHQTARNMCQLMKPENSMRCIELLKKEVEKFEQAAYPKD